MPPKRKKPGRPAGSKNKIKSGGETNSNHVKQEEITKESLIGENILKRLKIRTKKKCVMKIDLNLRKSIYSCKECNKKFRFKKSYTNHLFNEHSKLPGSVACNKCPVRCPDKATLESHITNIHERDVYECPHCKKQFVRHSHVLRHMAQKGCDGQQAASYPCEICNAQFSRKDNLMVHLRLQHIVTKDFSCKQCSYNTRTFAKLIIHTQKNHSETPHQYECDHCGKATSSRAAMTKHLEIHGERKYACDVCGYSTFTIEVMRRHVLTHVQDKPYKCTFCDRSFIQRVQLQKHLEKHKGKMCSKCDLTFTSKSLLLLHSREHTGLKALNCPYETCLYSKKPMSNEETLKNHIETHLEEKPFACEVCSKRFNSELNMRRHVSSHTLERPRRCMYCVAARAYVRGGQLVRHVRKSHPAVFRDHLAHVRQVLGTKLNVERVKKSEIESILNVLDAESDRILQGYGEGVLYGGMQELDAEETVDDEPFKNPDNPLMSEEELAENLNKLLSQLIDIDTLECFGWPDESVDMVLEKVIEHCGARPADREKWSRVQRLRENAKHLFLYVIEDKAIARMLDTHTIDQIVKHILAKVGEDDGDDDDDGDGDGDRRDSKKFAKQ